MNKHLSHKHMPDTLIFVLAICIAVCIVLFWYIGGYSAYDITGHWRICKYTLEGYNPYQLIGAQAPIESVGQIPAAFSTVPWSCVLGSAFYAGFLPLPGARIYIFALHFLILVLLIAVMCCHFCRTLTKKQSIALLMLPCAHFSFMYSVHYGNAGGVICCLLMIAFCISGKHPVLSGVLLGFSMMKPQITGIICLVFLLNRQWKTLVAAATIVIAGWVATALMTSTDLIELLMQTLSSGTAAKTQYLGLLNNLKYAGVDSVAILLMNVLIGCLYTVWLFFYLKKNGSSSGGIFTYVPACIASVFWVYKNGTDYLIVAYAAIFFLLLCMSREMRMKERIASILCIGYLEMSRCVVYVGAVLFEDNLFIRDLFKSTDGFVIGLIGIYLCKLWVRYKGDELLTGMNND